MQLADQHSRDDREENPGTTVIPRSGPSTLSVNVYTNTSRFQSSLYFVNIQLDVVPAHQAIQPMVGIISCCLFYTHALCHVMTTVRLLSTTKPK